MSRFWFCLSGLGLLGCVQPTATPVYAQDRDGHWLDRPFPSDELITERGFVDFEVLPEMPSPLGSAIVGGWAAQANKTVTGFSAFPAIYFQLDGPVDVETNYAGLNSDDIQLFSLDSDHRVPIEVAFIEASNGDPTLPDYTLQMSPLPTTPLRSGETYMAVLTKRLVRRANDWEGHSEAPKDAAIVTTFTVQDSVGQHVQLGEAVDRWLEENPSALRPETLRRVLSLSYVQGETPNGNPATISTVTYDGGETSVHYLYPAPNVSDVTLDLGADWPMEVWETEVETASFRDLTDQPWSNSGAGLLLDFERREGGWIDFDGDNTLQATPTAESMRIVIQVPKGDGPYSVMTWDHGTGGHAYNAVQRISTQDDSAAVIQTFADARTVVVSRDQPLYGDRYSLIEDGFGGSLGFYNIGNLPAFRDNQRQGGADHRVLHRFCRDELPNWFDVDIDRIGAYGHSLGSVTAHNGLIQSQGDGAKAAFMSGTGGYFTFYVLETGLLGTDNDVVSQIEPILGVSLEGRTAPELVAALVGLPESAWSNMTRMHPVMGLFQSIMDPSDPMVLAPAQTQREVLLMGVGDLQVPNSTTEWLSEALPMGELLRCEPSEDYDPHYCTYREEEGLVALKNFLDSL